MHKDLSDAMRENFEASAYYWGRAAFARGQSLAIAREAWLAAFDRAAEELDGGKDDRG